MQALVAMHAPSIICRPMCKPHPPSLFSTSLVLSLFLEFIAHSKLKYLKRERVRAPEESNCRASFGRSVSSVHYLPSNVQAPSTFPLLFLPRSLSFPLTNHDRIFNSLLPIYNPPPTPTISRSNHRSRCPKPQTRY